jgi:hypothetical protein
MANGTVGRRKAQDIENRCRATNRAGARCGNHAMEGAQICGYHLGRADPKKAAKTADRLIALTSLALDRLEDIIENGADDVAERAARTILDRTAPKPGAQSAIVLNLNPAPVIDGQVLTPAQIVRQRLVELAAVTQRQAHIEAEIIDAELVEEAS